MKIVGLKEGKNTKEIDHAYRKVARIYHSDKPGNFTDKEGKATKTGIIFGETIEHIQI